MRKYQRPVTDVFLVVHMVVKMVLVPVISVDIMYPSSSCPKCLSANFWLFFLIIIFIFLVAICNAIYKGLVHIYSSIINWYCHNIYVGFSSGCTDFF